MCQEGRRYLSPATLSRSVWRCSWAHEIKYNPPRCHRPGFQPQRKCSVSSQMHYSCFKRSPNLGVWQYLKSKQVDVVITGCVWSASPGSVWWCSRPRRRGSSAGWSCQRCPAPGARSGPPARWFPSVFQWRRVSPAWGREGGGVTDDRSHHRVTETLTALLINSFLYHTALFLYQNYSSVVFFVFTGVTTFSETRFLMIVNHLKALFSYRHRVAGTESWRSGHLPFELLPWWRCFLWLGSRAVATFSADAHPGVLQVQDIQRKPSCLLCFGLSVRAELGGVKCVCDRNIYLGASCLFTVAVELETGRGEGGGLGLGGQN